MQSTPSFGGRVGLEGDLPPRGKWLELGVFIDEDVMRAEPFESYAIERKDLWVRP